MAATLAAIEIPESHDKNGIFKSLLSDFCQGIKLIFANYPFRQ